jgi:hypothetical protein
MNEVMIHEMLRYFYHELSEDESGMYEDFLKDNPYLLEIYKGYEQTLDTLSPAKYAPQQTTIDKIIYYAQQGHLPTS